MSRRRIAIFSGIVTLCLISAGCASRQRPLSIDAKSLDCDKRFPLLNPWLRCEESERRQTAEYDVFAQELATFIQSKTNGTTIREVAVYFRDMNNGPWFGINEDEGFSPASLLKVPVLIAMLRAAEDDPEILERELRIDNVPQGMTTQSILPKETLRAGNTYTVDDLLRRMIVYSDNAAMSVVSSLVTKTRPEEGYLGNTLADAGIPFSAAHGENFMTVKQVAALFRMLYNASFLSRPMSQKALELLAASEFDGGIAAGVPKDTVVAHKFGERGDEQFHSCGIVYAERPYVLCILSRGNGQTALRNLVEEIAVRVHTEVAKH